MIHAVMHARILWLIAGVVLAGWRIDIKSESKAAEAELPAAKAEPEKVKRADST